MDFVLGRSVVHRGGSSWGHTVDILSEGSPPGDGLPSISGTEAAGAACARGRWRLNPSKLCRQMTLALKPRGGETGGPRLRAVAPPARRV